MTTYAAIHANRPPNADPADVPDRIDIASDEQEARYAPATVPACPDCGTTEDQCLPPGCCDPCEARATICPSGRHSSPDMDGLTLAMHERRLCGCGRAA